MQLAHTLLRFFLKFLGVRRKIGVFIAEKLIGYFARKQNPYIGSFVYRLAYKVHTYACAYGGNIVCAQDGYNVGQRL